MLSEGCAWAEDVSAASRLQQGVESGAQGGGVKVPLSPYLANMDRALRDINRRTAQCLHRSSYRCADCGTVGDVGFVSAPVEQKVRCSPCARAHDRRVMAALGMRSAAQQCVEAARRVK